MTKVDFCHKSYPASVLLHQIINVGKTINNAVITTKGFYFTAKSMHKKNYSYAPFQKLRTFTNTIALVLRTRLSSTAAQLTTNSQPTHNHLHILHANKHVSTSWSNHESDTSPIETIQVALVTIVL